MICPGCFNMIYQRNNEWFNLKCNFFLQFSAHLYKNGQHRLYTKKYIDDIKFTSQYGIIQNLHIPFIYHNSARELFV